MNHLRLLALGVVLLFIENARSTAADDARLNPKPATDSAIEALEADEQRNAVLHLSKPIENAILEAGHGSRIAFVEDVIMRTNPKACLLIVTVGLVPKSDKSKDGIIHNGFVVVSERKKPIVVYLLDETILSNEQLLANWLSDSNYKLPVGNGLTKLYEAKPMP